MQKLKMVKFWIVAFTYIIYHTIKNRNWHMVMADFEIGEDDSGSTKRKQLIADKRCKRMSLRWQSWPNDKFTQEDA